MGKGGGWQGAQLPKTCPSKSDHRACFAPMQNPPAAASPLTWLHPAVARSDEQDPALPWAASSHAPSPPAGLRALLLLQHPLRVLWPRLPGC